jgi:hypothetical protein
MALKLCCSNLPEVKLVADFRLQKQGFMKDPPEFKAAYITPLLKKVNPDPDDVRSHRPISNLSGMSKLLERLVA